MTCRVLVGEVVWNWCTGWKLSPALLALRQTSAASRTDGKKTKWDPFHLHSPWIVPLCRCRASSPGVGPSQAPQLLVLILAGLSSSTKQAWGGMTSKYLGLNLDCELCNTHRHTQRHKTHVVPSATGVGHAGPSDRMVRCASEFVGKTWSRDGILVSSPQTGVLMAGTLSLWKLPCLSSQWSWDNSSQSWIWSSTELQLSHGMALVSCLVSLFFAFRMFWTGLQSKAYLFLCIFWVGWVHKRWMVYKSCWERWCKLHNFVFQRLNAS